MIFASGLTRHRHLGMLLSLHVPRRNQSPPYNLDAAAARGARASERQVVVAPAGIPEIVGRRTRRSTHAGAVLAAHGPAHAAATALAAAPAAQELHGQGDDLGGLALLSFLV